MKTVKTPVAQPFLPEVHRDTTEVAAKFAGLDYLTSRRLSYFAEAPDESFRFDAIKQTLFGFLHPTYRWHVLTVLHSLHGGDEAAVKERQKRLLDLIRAADKKDRTQHWKIGFMIHAYQDSYSHVKPASQGGGAYGPIYGHLFNPSADKITYDFNRFAAITRGKHSALEGNEGDSKEIDAFIEKVRQAAERGGEKGAKHAIPRSSDERVPAWDAEIQGVESFLHDLEWKLKSGT